MNLDALIPLIESAIQSVMLETHYLEETEYPAGFDIAKFKSLTSFAARIKYAKQYLRGLGSGSSRVALAVNPTTVIKIAKNPKGLAQNKTEIDVHNVGYNIISQIVDFDPEGLWLEVERAQKFSVAKFKQATGFSFREFSDALNYWYAMNVRGSKYYAPQPAPNQEQIENSDLFTDVTTMVADFDMPVGDIMRPSSWGIVTRNGKEQPVLIDYGLTTDVLKTYYK